MNLPLLLLSYIFCVVLYAMCIAIVLCNLYFLIYCLLYYLFLQAICSCNGQGAFGLKFNSLGDLFSNQNNYSFVEATFFTLFLLVYVMQFVYY